MGYSLYSKFILNHIVYLNLQKQKKKTLNLLTVFYHLNFLFLYQNLYFFQLHRNIQQTNVILSILYLKIESITPKKLLFVQEVLVLYNLKVNIQKQSLLILKYQDQDLQVKFSVLFTLVLLQENLQHLLFIINIMLKELMQTLHIHLNLDIQSLLDDVDVILD